ncbi:16S rRNA (cytosine(1402)-N(4))-methyltransferase RsmH [Candidatus Riflebacteria bacterium]
MHKPVLLQSILGILREVKITNFLDATVGYFGHAAGILHSFPDIQHYIGIDRDPEAIEYCKKVRKNYAKNRITLIHSEFSKIPTILDSLQIEKVSAMLFDFGVSSPQFDDAKRGFSIKENGPLDMRMDPTNPGMTATEIVAQFSEKELSDIFFKFGEEKMSRRIAAEIIKYREKAEIKTTRQLQAIIENVKKPGKRKKIHVATKCFQALRIFVNDELTEIEKALVNSISRLQDNGLCLCISFHSLEDRIVKHKFKFWQTDCVCPRAFPVCRCEKRSSGKMLTTKPFKASAEELQENPRARSSRLRVFRKKENEESIAE